MNFEKIAERHLWLFDSKLGSFSEICVEIGLPRWNEPEVDASCAVYIRGLMSKPIDVMGSDLLSALECALDFAKAELKNVPVGHVVQWPGGESYFD